jgi:hypothetical protein
MYLLANMIDDFNKFMQIDSFNLEPTRRLSYGCQVLI